MTTPAPGEAVPRAEHEPVCSCHCHQSVYCVDCNRPTGPLDDDDVDARAQRIWARLLVKHPEWSVR